MPHTLSFPPLIITVVTMTGRSVAAANGQRRLYLRAQGVIDAVEEAASLAPWG
jgi:hypothetical protein